MTWTTFRPVVGSAGDLMGTGLWQYFSFGVSLDSRKARGTKARDIETLLGRASQ